MKIHPPSFIRGRAFCTQKRVSRRFRQKIQSYVASLCSINLTMSLFLRTLWQHTKGRPYFTQGSHMAKVAIMTHWPLSGAVYQYSGQPNPQAGPACLPALEAAAPWHPGFVAAVIRSP
jgi:hypothetical protein